MRASLAILVGVSVVGLLLLVGETRPTGASDERELQPGQVFRDCPECPEMVVIPAGSFVMGSPEDEEGHYENERPQHQVTIPRAFAMGRYEVTKSQFAAFVQASGHDPTRCLVWAEDDWEWDDSLSWRTPGFSQTESDPVVCVSWEDAKGYVEWLSGEAKKAYRLPSESEWEYAARAGAAEARFWGDEPDKACRYANVGDRSFKRAYPDWRWAIHDCSDGYVHTAPVGSFAANRYKLHDMLGNVWEWVEDCRNKSYSGAPADGSAWTTGDCNRRVVRCGAYSDGPKGVRSACRIRGFLGTRGISHGFRVARTLP